MSVIAQSFDSGFDLKPIRRRSANGPSAFPQPSTNFNTPSATLPGADYFLSTRIANGFHRQNVQIEKPTLAVDSQIKDQNVRRRASAPAMAKVYPAMTSQAPQVTVRRVAEGTQERPESQSEFPALRSELETLKRRASYPPALKSCFQRRQTYSDGSERKSVQFFGFVQVQYTHSPSDYDRSAIACIANGGLSESSRQEQLEELRKWQLEMNEKMPEAPSNAVESVTLELNSSNTSPVSSSSSPNTSASKPEANSRAQVCIVVETTKSNSELKPVTQNKPQKSQRRNRNRSKGTRAN